MAKTPPQIQAEITPSGDLVHLKVDDIAPSRNNPRQLFDRGPLDSLKKNIRQHGVLVPLTVYRPRGQRKYSILDGERRYRCCVELQSENVEVIIPANVVTPPSKIAGLLYMFSIHNFRKQWELMPTALGLKSVMEQLKEDDSAELRRLTGLTEPQIERCKILLSFPEEYQQLSLTPDPKERIPSNFWIELSPVLDLCNRVLPDLVAKMGRSGIIDALIRKYRAGNIKSVTHFRRIMEAYDVAEDARDRVVQRIRDFVTNVDLETLHAFDEFVVDNRRIRDAIQACQDFIRELQRLKLDYTLDRNELRGALKSVADYTEQVIDRLSGEDAPPDNTAE